MNFQRLTGEIKRLEALLANALAKAGQATIDPNLAAFVSVKRFGAKGDGVTNDAAAIQAGLAYTATYGQSLWFPKGTYLVSSAVTLPADYSVWVAGAEGGTATFTGANAADVANVALVFGVTPGTSAYNPAWYSLASIFIDPVAGSDANTGSTIGAPLKTWRECVRRWGTTSPRLAQNTTITFLGAGHSDDSDPVIFSPVTSNGALIAITGSQTVVASITLAGVVSKNRATPQLLNATLGASGAAGQLVKNTTAGKASTAWAYKVVAGTTFAMAQPMTPATVPVPTFPSEVDTWANGDTATLNTLTQINLSYFVPYVDDATTDIGGILSDCVVFDPSGTLGQNTCILRSVLCTEVYAQRNLGPGNEGGAFTDLINCFAAGGMVGGHGGNVTEFLGGVLGAGGVAPNQYVNFFVDGDAIVGSGTTQHEFIGSTALNATTEFGAVYVDTGAVMRVAGGATLGGSLFATQSIVWGPGIYDSSGRTIWSTAWTATSVWLNTGGLLLNGGTTGHSVTVGSPDVLNGGITVTVAHLDAATGAAGFGGNAFNYGGGAYVKADQF